MLRIGARAKINWTLDITGRRADGYHLMDMLMQSVTLADEITLEKTADGIITLTTGGTPLLPADEHHLALRAARALQKATRCPLGARIHVEKHIPVGAGMGGGSSDAAGVLVGLNRLWKTGLTRAELEAMGRASILIPSPNVAENHQYYNALELQNAGAAIVIEEKDLTGIKLIETVHALLAEPGKLTAMGTAAKTLGNPKSLELITAKLLELVNGK